MIIISIMLCMMFQFGYIGNKCFIPYMYINRMLICLYILIFDMAWVCVGFLYARSPNPDCMEIWKRGVLRWDLRWDRQDPAWDWWILHISGS